MIRVNNLHKTFRLYRSPADRLKEIFLRRHYCLEHHALAGVSFEVGTGQTIGIVGQNGAGKSTLLKILTGILLPDSGEITIDGKITGLLELGTGFNPEFTGIQNIYLNGTLLGMSNAEIDRKLQQIIDFTELGDFINHSLKTYSSGMIMRVAFAIAIHAEPKVFVVDEALSVGDAYFQQKCIAKIKEFKSQGGSIVFVSHDMNAVKVLCDTAMLLDHGIMVETGEPEAVINTYNFLLAKKSKGEELSIQKVADSQRAYGNFKVEIAHVEIIDETGHDSKVFISGKPLTVAVDLRANEQVTDITVGILIRDRFGQDIFCTNTHHLKVSIDLESHETCRLKYVIDELNLGPGKYTLTVAVHKDETHVQECYQWADLIKTFEVVSNSDWQFIGLARLKPHVVVEKESTPVQAAG